MCVYGLQLRSQPPQPNNPIDTDVQKRRFAPPLHAGHGERYHESPLKPRTIRGRPGFQAFLKDLSLPGSEPGRLSAR